MSMQHLFWAIANALWQSAAIAAVVGGSLRFIRRTTAAQRYALWFAVLVAAALLPIADLAMPSRTIAVALNAPQISHVVAPPVDVRPFVTPATHRIALPNLPPPLLMLWLAVALGLLARLLVAYASLRSVKSSLVAHESLTARVQAFNGIWSRHAVVGVSPRVAEPCAIGFLHPAIALSTEMAANLPERDLERVLRHEYAHVRRYDDYANLLQRLCAVIFWFNPVIHVAGRAMAIEREIACDDAAAAASDERVAFARCLYEIASTASPRRHAAASGFIGTRRQIMVRVARLVERNHNASTRLGSFAKITAVTVLAVALALAGVRLTALAVPQAVPITHVVAPAEPQIAKPVDRVEPALQAPTPQRHPVEKQKAVAHQVAFVAPASSPMADPSAPPVPPRFHPHLHERQPRASGPGLMDALAAAGFRNLSVDDLIMLQNRGVSPELIGELHAHGLTPMPASSLARLADSGVTGDYIGALAQLGYGNLSPEDYIRLSNAGVTPEFIQRLQRSGLVKGHPTVEQLIKLANAGL